MLAREQKMLVCQQKKLAHEQKSLVHQQKKLARQQKSLIHQQKKLAYQLVVPQKSGMVTTVSGVYIY